jgi:Na+(H+)/acetate symporter ActP
MYGSTLPRAAVPREEPVRHGARLRVVATPRPRTALAGVVVVLAITFVGLFYLSQTLESAAARYRVDALLVERQAMLMELQSQQGWTVSWGSEQQVTQWAQERLHRLGQPTRVRAR